MEMISSSLSHMLEKYRGQRLALLTKHGKEHVIAPLFERQLGCSVALVDSYDTDQLGTFTRDIPRTESQLATARTKALIAIERSGMSVGIGSEGSFVPDPFAGLMPWNLEIVVLIDTDLGLEIIGEAQGPGNHQHLVSNDWEEIRRFAEIVGFPKQHLVVRSESHEGPNIIKGLSEWSALEDACKQRLSREPAIFVETDWRAHGNPMRMQMIGRATEDLLKKIRSPCPACGSPGFSVSHRIPGLPCSSCGAPTRLIQAEVFICQRCSNKMVLPKDGSQYADPQWCDFCNP